MEKVKALKGGPLDMGKYAGLFTAKRGQLSGDITPAYCYLPESTIAEILNAFPEIKVVLLVRDPVDRCWSALNMLVRQGERTEEDLLDWGKLNILLREDDVALRSYPSDAWNRWSKFVPADRLRYFFFDQLIDHAAEFRAAIISFLGADPDKASGARPADYNRKANRKKVSMPDAIRERLTEHFCDELLACAKIFGGVASEWPHRYRASRF